RSRNRRSRPLRGVGRLELPGDPCRALGTEGVGQWRPGGAACALVVARARVLLPVVYAPVALARQQIGLVRVEMDLVGIDADAQFGDITGHSEEARLDAN